VSDLKFISRLKKIIMKKVLFVLAFLLASVSVTFAQRPMIGIDVVLGNRAPNPSEQALMTAEEQAHPNITNAMHDIGNAMTSVNNAPEEFGRNKTNALNALRAAYVALRRALYYRIYQDTH
jgi:hypothetical protein